MGRISNNQREIKKIGRLVSRIAIRKKPITSRPPAGTFPVTNLYYDSATGKLVFTYVDDRGVTVTVN